MDVVSFPIHKASKRALPSVSEDRDFSGSSRWFAQLHLTLCKTSRGTRLTENKHIGPLQVQAPFYPEGKDLAHIYLLHPPGGLVSGDDLNIHIQLKPNAHALATTPGAGRLYRARQDGCVQRQTLNFSLAAGASFEWLPQETIVFPNANGELLLEVDLTGDSFFCGWEVTCFGLPENDQPFDHGRLYQRLRVWRDSRLCLQDSLLISPAQPEFMTSKIGLQGATVSAVMLCTNIDRLPSALVTEMTLTLQNLCDTHSDTMSRLFMSVLDECLVIRYLGYCSAQARQGFEAVWSVIRPYMLQRTSCSPRIWST